MNQEQLSLLALSMLPGVGPVLIKNLVSYSGSAEEVFKKNKAKLQKIPGIGPKISENILHANVLKKAEETILYAEKNGVQILFYYTPEYPERLKQIPDAPVVLYYKGNANLNSRKHLAIVGTRQATEYGKSFTEELVQQLAPHQPLIISGLAYGIDIAAHKASLKYTLPTLGVLGSGLDVIYPAVHKETAKRMIEQGGILSEKPLGSKPEAYHFPERNRIIAGLCDAVVVVEAAIKGGALLTAEIANSYDREVFSVPGNIHQAFSEGCNMLIAQNKAHLLRGVEDIEYIMNWNSNGKEEVKASFQWREEDFEDSEWKIISLLKEFEKDLQIDELSWRTQIPIHQLASHLLNLEFKGLIRPLPGKMFKLLQ